MNSQTSFAESNRLPRSFHVVVKPLGSTCNLNCTYCYYLHKDDLLGHTTGGRMADELLEEFIRQYVAGQDVDLVRFNWHGGEPMLLGLDFYRKVVDLEQKYAGTKRMENDLQTNGVLLDDAWCEFLKRHRFHVGLSIDGPKHLHDRFRVTKGGEPTFDQVYRAARLLRQHDIPFTEGTWLLISDTTETHFPGAEVQGLGPTGNGGGRGFLLHSSLMVSPDARNVVGLAGQVIRYRRRVKRESGGAKRVRDVRLHVAIADVAADDMMVAASREPTCFRYSLP